MRKSYKKKRERNNKKVNEVIDKKSEMKSNIFTAVGVILFIVIFYGATLGLTALGVFEEGYTKPVSEAVEISYDEILIGNVFNKPETSYYVIFDTYGNNNNNVYVDYLVTSKEYDDKIYKVDMSNPVNEKYASNQSNKKATKVSELSIDGITLIKVTRGKILNYITGDTAIEEYLEKLSK